MHHFLPHLIFTYRILQFISIVAAFYVTVKLVNENIFHLIRTAHSYKVYVS